MSTVDRIIATHLKVTGDAQYQAAMNRSATATDRVGRAGGQASQGVGRLNQSASRASSIMRGLVGPMLGIGVALGAIGAAKWAIDTVIGFETAWAGVAKTVDGTDAELEAVRTGIIELSKRLPATTTEIAAVAEAAGQLGISTPNILNFTETMIGLGEATNLTADQAATAMARFSNIMGTPEQDIERVSSALVELGNNGASTEAEILEMAVRIAGAGNIIGLTESDVLALANALSSVGVEAEAGGSSISRVLVDINTAVETSGENLETFARVAGMSADEFARKWEANPAAALTSFIEGMGRMIDEGENVDVMLDEVGLDGIRTSLSLKNLAGAGDLLATSFSDGNRAIEENVALQDEINRRYATAASRLKVMGNNISAFVIQTGSRALPAFVDTIERGTGFLRDMGTHVGALDAQWGPAWGNMTRLAGELWDMVEPIIQGLAMIGGAAIIGAFEVLGEVVGATTGFLADHREIVAIIAALYAGSFVRAQLQVLAGFVAMKNNALLPWLAQLSPALTGVANSMRAVWAANATASVAGAGFAAVRAGVTGLVGLINPVAVALAGAALAGYGIATMFNEGKDNARAFIDQVNNDFQNVPGLEGMAGRVNALTEEYNALIDKASEQGAWEQAAGNVVDVLVPFHNVEDSAADLRGELGELGAEIERQREIYDSWKYELEAIQGVANSMGFDATQEQIEAMAEAMELDPTAPETWANIELRTREYIETTQGGTPAVAGLTGAVGAFTDVTADATDRVSALKDGLDSLFGITKGLHDATTDWVGAIEGLRQQATEMPVDLSAASEAGRQWRDDMSSATDSAFAMAESMYENGASIEQVADFMGRHRQALIDVASQSNMTDQEVQDYIATLGLTPENIETLMVLFADQANRDAEEVQGRLDDVEGQHNGSINLDASAAMYALDVLQQKIAVIQAGSQIRVTPSGDTYTFNPNASGLADGAVRFGRGGFHENHVAQIARAGEWRVWAEDETGGEGYIPLAASKRPRSTAILGTIASMFGYSLVPNASGSLYTRMPMAGRSNVSRSVVLNVDPGAVQVSLALGGGDYSSGQVRQMVESKVDNAIDGLATTILTALKEGD